MKYVIIGGDAAGMSAAMEIYRHDETAQITTLEKGQHYSYGQCGLPYVIDGTVPKAEDVVHKTAAQFREKYAIDARTGHCVTKIDAVERKVYGYKIDSSENFEVAYDRLLIATGAEPKRALPDAQYEMDGIYHFKTIPHTQDIQRILDDIQQVTIIGGGYIALELAETFKQAGKQVRIILRGSQVASFLEYEFAEKIQQELLQQGVEIVFNEKLQRYEGDGHVVAVQTDRATYPTDIVVEAVGVEPNTAFLEDSGVYTLKNGAILVNPHMETSMQYVYGAGDCASHYHNVKGKNDYIPLGTTANKQGRIAGLNMSGTPEEFRGIVGTSILKCFDLQVAKSGLNEHEAKALGYDYETYTHEAGNHASYYPNVEQIYMKMIWRKRSQELLGIQLIGKDGIDKRIDVFATALHQRLKLHDLIDLDLSYAPPFNSVWDPLQQLAKRQF